MVSINNINLKVIEQVVRQIDKRIVFMTILIFGSVYLIISKGMHERYENKLAIFQKEQKRISLAQHTMRMQKEASMIDKKLFDSPDVGLVLSYINDSLEKYKVNIVSLNPGKEFYKNMMVVRPLSIMFEGTYSQVASLIDELDNAEKFIFVEYCEIRKKKNVEVQTIEQVDDPILLVDLRVMFFAKK